MGQWLRKSFKWLAYLILFVVGYAIYRNWDYLCSLDEMTKIAILNMSVLLLSLGFLIYLVSKTIDNEPHSTISDKNRKK